MVKSGLDNRIVEERDVPRVSHYRLAAHLGTAFVIYILGIWNSLTLLQKPIDAKVSNMKSNQKTRSKRSDQQLHALICLRNGEKGFVELVEATHTYTHTYIHTYIHNK